MGGRRRASEPSRGPAASGRPGRATALLLALCPALAAAHGEVAPKRDRLELGPGGVRLELEYAVPAGEEARALRRLFDLDRSGGLDAGEEARLAEHLARLATAFLRLSLDGRQLPLGRVASEPALGGDAAERLAVRLTLSAAVRLDDGPHRLRVEDRHKDRRVLVPLVLRLQGLALEGPPPPPLPMLHSDEPLELRLRPAAGLRGRRQAPRCGRSRR